MKKLFVLSFITLLIVSGVQNVKAETFTQKGINIEIVDVCDVDIQEAIYQINSIEIFKPGGCLTDNLFYPCLEILTNEYQDMAVEKNLFMNKKNSFQDYFKGLNPKQINKKGWMYDAGFFPKGLNCIV